MSHLVAVKEYTDAADIFASRRALRTLFYGLPAKLPEPELIEVVAQPEPEPAKVSSPLHDWLILASEAATKPAPYRDILSIVQASTGVSIIDIKSSRRNARLVAARQITCWLMRRHTTMSFPQIGRRLGGRDHTTILHGCRQIDAKMDRESDFRSLMAVLSDAVMSRQSQ